MQFSRKLQTALRLPYVQYAMLNCMQPFTKVWLGVHSLPLSGQSDGGMHLPLYTTDA